MRIAQICVCVLLYFVLKATAFDVPSQLSKWQKDSKYCQASLWEKVTQELTL